MSKVLEFNVAKVVLPSSSFIVVEVSGVGDDGLGDELDEFLVGKHGGMVTLVTNDSFSLSWLSEAGAADADILIMSENSFTGAVGGVPDIFLLLKLGCNIQQT